MAGNRGNLAPSALVSAAPYLVGYARVSTDEQILDLQMNALRAAGCQKIYTEKISGASLKRPQLDLAIKELLPGDTLVVWKLDRLARNNQEVFRRVAEIEAAGATFKSLTENFGFDTPSGKLLLSILAGLAQFERDLTIARTKAGMDAAKLRGSQIGAPVKFTASKKVKARQWVGAGVKHAAVAKRLDLSAGTISSWVKKGMP